MEKSSLKIIEGLFSTAKTYLSIRSFNSSPFFHDVLTYTKLDTIKIEGCYCFSVVQSLLMLHETQGHNFARTVRKFVSHTDVINDNVELPCLLVISFSVVSSEQFFLSD